MKITTLIENTPGNTTCEYQHGLSLYIETKKHKLLVDTGANAAFIQNAKQLGIDLRQVDTVILSHGHYDHAGGLMEFADMNPKAVIYLRENAVEDYYHVKETGDKYIGIDKEIANLPQCIFVKGDMQIDEELSLFTNIEGRKFIAKGNSKLTKKENGQMIQDDFSHEQCLVVTQKDKKYLISGCAHNGIVNILDRYEEIYQSMPDVVISGFHLKQENYTEDDLENVRQIAEILKEKGPVFYSGHCTGETAFALMKEIMGDYLFAIHSGDVILKTK